MKSRISLFIICCSFSVLAQDNNTSPKFEQVILDSKPAFINVQTGEIVSEIPNGSSHSLNTSMKATKASVQTSSGNLNATSHKVAKGETLYSISKKYGISLATLKELNSSAAINALSIGQEIIVKKGTTAATSVVATSPTSDYIVKKGETLYSISRKFNISVSDLKSKNNLTTSMLSIGQTLKVN
ncbi:LysM peptidoglycan-binding domain-containing protein [Patiriisocius marinus]|uniref:LysM peptidoglycan-binding domain-containing protein n=1 Tax=Patiriisocius marinus TaxID=1397112 RepID=UPI00232EDAD2|nr:LysM peptidoglycan-binding domain-containing protein [Patiriisocius marinus]